MKANNPKNKSKGQFRKGAVKRDKYEVVGIELGNSQSYIVAYKNNGKYLYPLLKKKDTKESLKFGNLQVAKMAAESILGKKSRIEYHVVIIRKECNFVKEYNLADAVFINGYYQLYDSDLMIKYYIKERHDNRISWIGYLGLDNGLTERKDKSYGINRSKEFFDAIWQVSHEILLKNKTASIDKIYSLPDKEIMITVKDSTAEIHIVGNSKIMDINQRRKELGERCIPYDKSVDKFLTVFVYITTEKNEMKFFNSAIKAEAVLKEIVDNIRDLENFNSIESKSVAFVGQIFVKN